MTIVSDVHVARGNDLHTTAVIEYPLEVLSRRWSNHCRLGRSFPGVGPQTIDLEPLQSDLPLVVGHPLYNLKAIVYGATNSGTLIVGEAVDVLTATRTTALP